MIIWTRFGILYPVLWFITGYILGSIGIVQLLGSRFGTALAILIIALINAGVAGAEEMSGHRSSLFFIPMVGWTFIGFLLAIAFAVGLLPR